MSNNNDWRDDDPDEFWDSRPLTSDERAKLEFDGWELDGSNKIVAEPEAESPEDLIVLITPDQIPETERPEDGLYFIKSESGHMKIGRSTNAKERLSALQIGNPHQLKLVLELPKLGFLERDLHRLFDEDRVHGEWFTITPKMNKAIAALRSKAKRGSIEGAMLVLERS